MTSTMCWEKWAELGPVPLGSKLVCTESSFLMCRPVRNWHLKAILISEGNSPKESLSLGDVSYFHPHEAIALHIAVEPSHLNPQS